MITDNAAKALSIVKQRPGIEPEGFAKAMWPESNGWRRSVRAGKGSARGGGMRMAGGSYLGKLAKRGYVVRRYTGSDGGGFYLTDSGKQALQEWRAALTAPLHNDLER